MNSHKSHGLPHEYNPASSHLPQASSKTPSGLQASPGAFRLNPNPPRIVMLGSSGVGKSTLLNALLQSPKFHAGPSLGQPLTKRPASWSSDNGPLLIDTHALVTCPVTSEDLENNELLGDILTSAQQSRLVFVTTLEHGRVRNSDVATFAAFCAALEKHVVLPTRASLHDAVSLVVNKVPPAVFRSLQTSENRALVIAPFSFIRNIKHVLVVREFNVANGKRDALLPCQTELTRFVDDAPTTTLAPSARVQLHLYPAEVDDIVADVEVLREELDAHSEAASPYSKSKPSMFCVGREALKKKRRMKRMHDYSKKFFKNIPAVVMMFIG